MRVRIRKARPSDKAPLLDFIKDVWGGHDYIPRVWDSWILDKEAELFVVEVDGKPVGMNRMRILPDGNAWLEGARIHPDYRGQGLASLLGTTSMEAGLQRGARNFRLSSSSRNDAAHRQIARMGFREISRVSVYEAPAHLRFREQKGVRKAEERDLREVQRIVEGSREYRIGAGVYWSVFAAIGLTKDTISSLVREGSVFLCSDAVAVARLGGEGGETWRQICFVAGNPEGVSKMVKHLLGRKEKVRTSWRLVYVPQGSALIRTLKAMGLKRAWSLVLFEGKTPKG